MSTKRFVAVVVIGLVFGIGLVAPGLSLAQKGPADFTLESKDSPGPVTFSHAKHKEAGAEKCNACHTKVFKMKKGGEQLTMAKMKAGEQCGACHNGKTEMGGKKVFSVDDKANCEKCHTKK